MSNYALSRDGKYLAASSDYGANTVRLYEMASGKVLCDFDAPRTNSPASFAFSPDNTRLAAIGLKGVHLWDVTTGQELPSLPFKSDLGTNGAVNGGCLVFAPDGKILAGARSYYERNTGTPIGEVYLWNLDRGSLIACIEGAGFNNGTMAFSPNGKTLALPMQNQSVLLVKAATGRELGRLDGSQSSLIQGLAFSPDGRLLAGAQQNSQVFSPLDFGIPVQTAGTRVLVWELASGQIRQEFTGHQAAVACLAFAPDGRTLASGSYDTTALLWALSGTQGLPVHALTPDTIEAVWNDLAEKNGQRAYQELMTGMIGSPELCSRFCASISSRRRERSPTPPTLNA